MKTDVYHYQKDLLTGNREFVQIGTVVGKTITPDIVWELTNWSCWIGAENIYRFQQDTDLPIDCDDCVYNRTRADMGYTSHDIMFELNNIWYTAERFGFAEFNTRDEAKQHLVKTNPT